MTEEAIADAPTGRWQRLKEATAPAHQRIDARIMAAAPFASRERYGLFLQVQHAFHHDISNLYHQPELQSAFADLPSRARLTAVAQDLADLGLSVPAETETAHPTTKLDAPAAAGWLYVAEGSNLGAAFLLKAANRLGLNEDFGARHLAAAPEGRGISWRKFTAALDAMTLTRADEERLFAAARDAFERVHALVELIMPLPGTTPASQPEPPPEGAAA